MCERGLERSMRLPEPVTQEVIRPMSTKLNYQMARLREADYVRQAEESRRANQLVMSNGTRVSVRPLGPEDRAGFATLFGRLSPESRLRRFLSPKRELAPRELTYLTDVDHCHHAAIAAVDQRDGSIVGTARYVRPTDRAHVAEVAIEVVDELQRMRIGTALADLTIQRARINGVGLLTATTLWDNRAARALPAQHGFRAVKRDGGEIEYELELEPLTPASVDSAC
jgi:RimJ/RimL family protein N-acetyltransferase